jgi:hypothetical protein
VGPQLIGTIRVLEDGASQSSPAFNLLVDALRYRG